MSRAFTQSCVQLEQSAVAGQIFLEQGKHTATVTLLGVKPYSLWQWRLLEAYRQQLTTPEIQSLPLLWSSHLCVLLSYTGNLNITQTKCWNACTFNWNTACACRASTGNFYLAENAPEKVIAIWQSKHYHPPGADGTLKMQHKIIPFLRVAQSPPSSKLKSSCKTPVKASWFTQLNLPAVPGWEQREGC